MNFIDPIPVHESRHADKVVKYVKATVEDLSEYCSVRYAKRIMSEKDNGTLWGIYFTPSGRIKATFI